METPEFDEAGEPGNELFAQFRSGGIMNKETHVSRRDFLKSTTRTGVSLAALGTASFAGPKEILGANNRIRVAVCGLHSRGWSHVRGLSEIPNVQVAALCEVDDNVLQKRLADMEKLGMPKPEKTYFDVRQLLDDKTIDAITIATPNSWHSLMAIWACQAGKDVYVEKPCSHNWWEGRQLVRAAQKYKRAVQHGTQSRSSKAGIETVRKLRQGLIGDVYLARGICYKRRNTIGTAPIEPVPPGVHYDLWTGPAPLEPFTHNRFHYNWHWLWDFGNGDLGNQGIHQIDNARWGLGVGFPNKVSAMGGHFMFDDDQQTPNTLNCSFEYDMPGGPSKRKMIEFEVRHWITNNEAEIGTPAMGSSENDVNYYGNVFYGTNGYLAMASEDVGDMYRSWIGKDVKPGPHNEPVEGLVPNLTNLLDVMRSRKMEDLNAPILEAHISCTVMHLANASYRLGKTINFDPETQQVIGDEEASRLLRDADRGYRRPFYIPEDV
jgi:predicted dehydrogenase